MGLEPVWKSHRVVLASDAGGLMDAEADKSWTWRIKRYQSIQECQARGVRKRLGEDELRRRLAGSERMKLTGRA